VKSLAILGSTGSIGQSALAVVDAYPDRLRAAALAAGDNATLLAGQVRRYCPEIVGMATTDAADRLKTCLAEAPGEGGRARAGREVRTVYGPEGLLAVATHPSVDIVICASSGTAGLEAVIAAIEHGKTVALANKEVLVMAGQLVTDAARRHGVAILPVDSEHNAIHQCLHGRNHSEIKRLILTASGGPFRQFSADALDTVDAAAALQHPTWRMGRKITIDSATLMNKGLEVIEAHWLFGVSAEQIDVVIHPQSIVHSLVELIDGSIIAQLGITDMRLPIQYACSYPDRWDARSLPTLDLLRAGQLDFHAPARDRFPCLDLAYRALRTGGTLPVVLNAANEVAVEHFLDGKLGFTAIPRVIQETMDAHDVEKVTTVDVVRRVDRWSRECARHRAQALELNA